MNTKKIVGFTLSAVVVVALVVALLPVLSMIGLGLLALLVPLAVMFAPFAVIGLMAYLLAPSRDKAEETSVSAPGMDALGASA